MTAVAVALISGGAFASMASASELEPATVAETQVTTADDAAAPSERPQNDAGAETSNDGKVETKDDKAVEGAVAAVIADDDAPEDVATAPDDATPSEPVNVASDRGPPVVDDGEAITATATETATTATIVVKAGGDRTGATGIAPLEGVEFALFSSQDATERIAEVWALAVSGDDGEAVFQVPVTGANQQYWVKATYAPSGWTLNPTLATSPIRYPETAVARAYAFQTPELAAGHTYTSGASNFMGVSTSDDEAYYKGSLGTWAVSRENPPMPETCEALKIALILDKSNSITTESQKTLREAAKEFITAFTNTSMSMRIFEFGTRGGALGGLTALTPTGAEELKGQINSLSFSGTQYTNWDEGMWQAVSGDFDLAIVFTDGNPTIHGVPNVSGNGTVTVPSGSGNTRFYEMERGIFAANALKAQGTRVEVVAVGAGVSNAPTMNNLLAISGEGAVTTTGWAEAARNLRTTILKECTPSVTVTKKVQAWNGTIADAVVAPGWDFTLTDLENFTRPDGVPAGDWTQTTGAGGTVFFDFDAADPSQTGSVTIEETQQPGYTLVSTQCVRINSDTTAEGAPVDMTQTGLGFTVTGIGVSDMIKCEMVNQAPAPLEPRSASAEATVSRDFDWSIEKSASPSEQETAPGQDVDFDYRLEVRATGPQVSSVTVTGLVVLKNPSGVEVPLDDVVVTVGGTPAVLAGSPTSVAAHGEAEVAFTAELANVPESGLPIVVTSGDRQPERVGQLTEVDVQEFDETAVVDDMFDEQGVSSGFAGKNDEAARTLDARNPQASAAWDAEQGAWILTYTASMGADVLAPNGWKDYTNTATVQPTDTPDDGTARPGDDQDPGDLTDTETVTVTTGPPLKVGAVTVHGAYDVDYDWAIEKLVVGPDDQETTPGEDVTFGYQLRVAASKDVGPLRVDGTVTITNPSNTPLTLGDDDLVVTVGGVEATLTLPTGPVTIKADDSLDVSFTAALDVDDVDDGTVPVVVSLPAQNDVVTSLDFDAIVPTVNDATAVLEDTFPELATAFTEAERTLVAEDVIAVGGVTFDYTADRGSTTPADGGVETFTNVATVYPSGPDPENPPADGWEDDQDPGDLTDDETVTVRTPPVYDLALRMWVAEVWRDGVQVFERYSDPSNAGPEYVIPHATFDHEDFDIQVGDLVVQDIHLFNQGDRTARVDELVNYKAHGLEYVGDEWLETIPNHHNPGWQQTPDGLLDMSLQDDGIVLAPGESAEISLVLRVTEDALSDDGEHADRFTFAEIAAFSGWVPETGAEPEATPERSMVAPFAAPALYDGVAGYWSSDVVDIDSVPDRDNGGTDVDDTTLVYHSWEDNEIGESNTTMLWDDGENDYDNDEDDHDGAIIRVFRAVNEVPADPDPSLPPVAPSDPSLDAPSPAAPSSVAPSSAAPSASDPTLVTRSLWAATGGTVSLPVAGAAVAALVAAAALLATAGVVLLRRRRTEPIE